MLHNLQIFPIYYLVIFCVLKNVYQGCKKYLKISHSSIALNYYIFVLLSFVFLFSSCGTKFDRSIFDDADMIIVEMYNDQSSFNPTIFKITNKNEILEFSNYISAKSSPWYKCGYNGKISFMKNGAEFINMEFNLSKECRHIVFIQNDRWCKIM